MPLQATSGAASYDAFGGGVPVVPAYIEEVFSTWLYTGTGATQTITNGIDLSTNGGMVWIAGRSTGDSHPIFSTNTGTGKVLFTTSTAGTDTYNPASQDLMSFNTNGFTLGTNYATSSNSSGVTKVSWTFRKQPKFFDVVTYTGNGNQTQNIAHSLGSTPGCIIIKRTNSTSDWNVSHRAAGGNGTGYFGDAQLFLNTTAAINQDSSTFFCDEATDTTFRAYRAPGSSIGGNISGATYVAYLFAHNAGGFGLTGTDNVISCGSFNYNTDPQTVTIGYEPQWLMVKQTDGTGDWIMFDNMRGFTANAGGGIGKRLLANTSGAETNNDGLYYGGATGFNLNLPSYGNYIYIAIRRGPMKVPTSGTSVFTPVLGRSANPNYLAGFPVDLGISEYRVNGSNSIGSRLQGSNSMNTASTGAEASDGSLTWDFMNGYYIGGRTTDFISWAFRRAPSFFDEVCYTGTGVATTFSHNLGVVPELMIVKSRSTTGNWQVFHKDLNALGTEPADDSRIRLNSDAAATANNLIWNSTLPTSAVFSVGASSDSNGSGVTFVNYLFATCAGVSKVTSFTGNGSSQTINCGFTAGSRFVMIKRTDSTGDWYVWDSARGIVSGNDPHLSLNSTAAEVTTDDTIDTDSTGFIVNQVSATNSNVNGASYIVLAIA
jgi:hypothetical protein